MFCISKEFKYLCIISWSNIHIMHFSAARYDIFIGTKNLRSVIQTMLEQDWKVFQSHRLRNECQNENQVFPQAKAGSPAKFVFGWIDALLSYFSIRKITKSWLFLEKFQTSPLFSSESTVWWWLLDNC